jgi:hypothetical protein
MELLQAWLRHTVHFEGDVGFHMREPQLQKVQESVTAVALDAHVEMVRRMQDELFGAGRLTLDDAVQFVDAQLLSLL